LKGAAACRAPGAQGGSPAIVAMHYVSTGLSKTAMVRRHFAFSDFSPGTDTSFPRVKPHHGVHTRAERILKNFEKREFDVSLAKSQLDNCSQK
jgi:hypothetical protein